MRDGVVEGPGQIQSQRAANAARLKLVSTIRWGPPRSGEDRRHRTVEDHIDPVPNGRACPAWGVA